MKSGHRAHARPLDLEAAGDTLYAVQPNHGEVDAAEPDGAIRHSSTFPLRKGHIVPTSLMSFYGQFLFDNLYAFDPGSQGKAGVSLLTRRGKCRKSLRTNRSAGVAVHHGRIYALESFTGFIEPAPSVANTKTFVRLELRAMGCTNAQGYYLSRPVSL